jgi:hypothetical protein
LPAYNWAASLNCHVPAGVTAPSRLYSFWQEKNKADNNSKREAIFRVFIDKFLINSLGHLYLIVHNSAGFNSMMICIGFSLPEIVFEIIK